MEGASHSNANFHSGLNNKPTLVCVWKNCSCERCKLVGKQVKRNCQDPGRKQHGCERVETGAGGDVEAAERHNNLWNTGAELDAKAGTAALRRVPIDAQPHAPCRLPFQTNDSAANMTEPAIVDRGRQSVDVTVKWHPEKTGQPMRAKLRRGACCWRKGWDERCARAGGPRVL